MVCKPTPKKKVLILLLNRFKTQSRIFDAPQNFVGPAGQSSFFKNLQTQRSEGFFLKKKKKKSWEVSPQIVQPGN